VGGWLDALLASGAEGTVVIVAHSGSIRAALCHLFGVPLSEVFKVRIDYGRVSAVHIGPRGQELICLNAITAP
jgi:broad specificity phosphatase PhoE